MPARVSEAIVLRTYPFRESSLIVSFFTREEGKMRGVARGVRKPKNLFGSGLERLSEVRMHYSHRENRELQTLVSCDLVHSQFGVLGNYEAGVSLDFIAEVSEQLLPPLEPNERFYRLLSSVLAYLRERPEQFWPVVTYFSFWAVRLSGFLPELTVSPDSIELASEFLQRPVHNLTERSWTKATARDLRRLMIRQIEDHVEHKLLTVPLLEAL